jgi:hypothetical protein
MVDILSRPRVERTLGTEVTATVGSPLRAKTRGYDRDVAINTYEAAARIVPAVRSEHDSRIEVVVFAGRSLDAKRARYQVLVANLSALGVWATDFV